MARTVTLSATASVILNGLGFIFDQSDAQLADEAGNPILDESGTPPSIVPGLPVSGSGVASTGPQNPGEIWHPDTVSVSCSTNANEAICKVYAGNGPSQQYFSDGTTWGSTGDSTGSVSGPVYPGQEVFAIWTGGDPGATATMTVTGTRQVP